MMRFEGKDPIDKDVNHLLPSGPPLWTAGVLFSLGY